MLKFPDNVILEIDPSADVERVKDFASEAFRFFSEMTREEWAECVRAVNMGGVDQ